jgi:hypothetical protein
MVQRLQTIEEKRALQAEETRKEEDKKQPTYPNSSQNSTSSLLDKKFREISIP